MQQVHQLALTFCLIAMMAYARSVSIVDAYASVVPGGVINNLYKQVT
jgi:hypothetical protein